MILIVVPSERVDLLLCVFERRKPVHVQTLFAEASIERFDSGVVGRLASTTEVEDDAVGVRPQIHRGADELRAVVDADRCRFGAALKNPAQGRGDLERRVAEAIRDGAQSQ